MSDNTDTVVIDTNPGADMAEETQEIAAKAVQNVLAETQWGGRLLDAVAARVEALARDGETDYDTLLVAATDAARGERTVSVVIDADGFQAFAFESDDEGVDFLRSVQQLTNRAQDFRYFGMVRVVTPPQALEWYRNLEGAR